jgi:hypothetical protein
MPCDLQGEQGLGSLNPAEQVRCCCAVSSPQGRVLGRAARSKQMTQVRSSLTLARRHSGRLQGGSEGDEALGWSGHAAPRRASLSVSVEAGGAYARQLTRDFAHRCQRDSRQRSPLPPRVPTDSSVLAKPRVDRL